MKNIPQNHESVEYLHRGLAVECGTLTIFLELLRVSATVFVMPLERTLTNGSGTRQKQFAIHLTARKLERESPVYYCTFPAAQISSVGEQGQLVFPSKSAQKESDVFTHARQLVAELQACLIAELEADPRVHTVLAPARYRLPDAWIWGRISTLDGSAIRFHEGHWISPKVQR